ncbi:MAG: apolipoprotein N-acyltransferase [Armatimonadetes bacterium]|nr:apolipoprotein N-acyltransferase [Armatimonadota bacterium]
MKWRERLLKPWPVVASAALLLLAFPPFNLSLLVFVAAAPWIASLRKTDPKGALRSSALFGALYIAGQMYWVVPFIADWTKKPALALVPWAVCAVLGALIYLPLGWLVQKCWAYRWAWLIPFVWAGHEAFRAYLVVLAFPWGILANPLWSFPQFVQLASFGTVFAVSAWSMVPNIVLAMFVWPPERDGRKLAPDTRSTFRAALVFGSLMMVSAYRYANPPSVQKKVVTLGQPGIDMAFTPRDVRKLDLAAAGTLIQSRALSQGSEILFLPEGFSDDDPRIPPFSPLGERPGLSVVLGGKRPADGSFYQTAFSYDDGAWDYADKTRLVVFGEYVPFRGSPLLANFNLPGGDLTPAKELKTLKVSGVTIGPLLCFEGVFPDLADRHGRLGAQVLAQLSIDDWYEKTPAWEQLWQSSVWRSIESGLPLVRVGGRGQTLATDVRGNVTTVVPQGKMAAARVELGVPSGSDAFAYRMAFPYFCWALCGSVAIYSIVDRLAAKRAAGKPAPTG